MSDPIGPKGTNNITGTPSASERPKSSVTFTVKPKTAPQTDDAKAPDAALFSDSIHSGTVTTNLSNPTTRSLDKRTIANHITTDGGFVPTGLQESSPRTTAGALNGPNLEPTPFQQDIGAELKENGIPVPAALTNGGSRTVGLTPSKAPQP